MKEIICKDCKKPVSEISEYVDMAEEENMDVNEWVALNDNLYNRRTNTVICTSCYVKGIISGIYV